MAGQAPNCSRRGNIKIDFGNEMKQKKGILKSYYHRAGWRYFVPEVCLGCSAKRVFESTVY